MLPFTEYIRNGRMNYMWTYQQYFIFTKIKLFKSIFAYPFNNTTKLQTKDQCVGQTSQQQQMNPLQKIFTKGKHVNDDVENTNTWEYKCFA